MSCYFRTSDTIAVGLSFLLKIVIYRLYNNDGSNCGPKHAAECGLRHARLARFAADSPERWSRSCGLPEEDPADFSKTSGAGVKTLQLVMKADGSERKIALPFSFSYF
jgi:hypothetical protein